ncbi:AraC family transcriptional regulator [Flammeovirga sp. EKP202]|uniref:helix-turn-helix domain-containing protein n=1 Tax=Flammeovirga sp. EKP202 TaxID=2770592 RepID=UPI00165FE786|nr:helix-turn-helix domain-containing protein [Flammeovirga sp. EKP202]MBD0402625.1 AraC family transcriptional regulator [Flammeovirga sp. EKP202]
MEQRDFDKALEAWGRIFNGKRVEDSIIFNNELGQGVVDGFRFNDQMEILRFDFYLKQKIASTGKQLNTMDEYIPIFFGEPSEKKTIDIENENNEKEEFAFFTEGAFTTNTKDTVGWELFPHRKTRFVSIRLKKEYYKFLASKSEYYQQLFLEDAPYYIFEEFDPVMHGMFWRMYSDEVKNIYEQELVHASALHLVATFFSKVNERENILESNKYPFNTKAVFKARNYLKSQVSQPVQIDDLARECGLSASRLRALFKQVFGVTIHQFHQDVRLDLAKTYLQEGERTMSMIAMDLGFSSASHFSANFKKKYGVTPREFKDDLRK